MLAKEDHQKSVSEVEKCHAIMTCQFGIIKGTHERLERNGKYVILLLYVPALMNECCTAKAMGWRNILK